METTYVTKLLSGTESGRFLALDLGSTNFRKVPGLSDEFFILFHSECLIEDLTVQGPAGLAHRGEDRVGGCEALPRVHGDQAGAGGGAVQLPG